MPQKRSLTPQEWANRLAALCLQCHDTESPARTMEVEQSPRNVIEEIEMRLLIRQFFRVGAACCLLSGMILAAEPSKNSGATARSKAPRNVAVFLFNGVELLDFAGPADVFSAAGSGYKVYTVAETTEPIVSQGFVKVVPEFSIQNCPKPDVLVIPGGNTAAPLASPEVIAWIKGVSENTEVTMSVCTGAFILAKAGLLD